MSGRYARTRKLIKVSGHLSRAALLIVAALTVSTYFVWSFKGSLVDSVDSYIVERHFNGYAKSLSEAKALLAESKLPEARAILESLLSGLGRVRKQDRRAGYYAEAQDLLLFIASRENDHPASLSVARALTEFDSNNYNYWLNLAYILNSGGEKTEAIKALRNAFRIAPASIQTAEPLSTLLFEEGKKDEAREVIKGFINASRGGSIAVYHASKGAEFSQDKTSRLISIAFTGRDQRISLPLKASGVERLRLELPAILDLNIRVGSVALSVNGRSETLDFKSLDYGLHDLSEESGGVLTVTGSRPHIEFKLPERLMEAEILSIDIEAAFFQSPSEGIMRLKRALDI